MHHNADTLIKQLNDVQSWGSSSIANAVQIALSSSLRTTVRPIQTTPNFFVFHVNLSKIADAAFTECLIFLISAPTNLPRENINALLEQIEHIITNELPFGQPSLILLFNGAVDLFNYIESSFPNSFIGSDSDFKKIIYSESDSRTNLLQMLRKRGLDITKCPFHYLGPVQPDMFVGREDLINEILGWSQTAYVIPGGRRIGKSSLLLKLKAEAEKIKADDVKPKYETLYIDCSNFNSFQSLIEEIERKISPKSYFELLRKARTVDFQKILERFSGLKQKTLLLLLDEMDPLIKHAKTSAEDSLYFYNVIRNHANKDKLRLVISGFIQVYEMVNDSKHPFNNLCVTKNLGFLEEKDVKKLLLRPFLKLGIQIGTDSTDQTHLIDRIYKFTAGHPSLVQFIARQLFQTRTGNIITNQDLDRVIHSGDLIDFVLDNFMMNSSLLERFICTQITQIDSFNLDKLIEEVDKSGLNLKEPDTKLHRALRNLQFNNILLNEQGKYRFLYPLMQSIIRENYAAPNIIRGLKRDIEQEEQNA